MQIAVCDDEAIFSDQLTQWLHAYGDAHRLDLTVDEYRSGEQLLGADTAYDVIFMDYRLTGADGLAIAQELRRRRQRCALVFVTNYPDFVYDAFAVETFQFLRKPITAQMVNETMNAYLTRWGNDQSVLLKANDASVRMDTGDIVFLEAARKRCLVHTPQGVVEVNGPMLAIEAMLPASHFFRIHKAYIVNFNYVMKISHNEVYFTTGDTAYVSRTNVKSFKEAFRAYIKR